MSTRVQPEMSSASGFKIPTAAIPGNGRLRLLHVVSRLGLGGTEHGVLKLMRGLGEELFEHRICAVRGVDAEFTSRMGVTAQACTVASARPGFQFPLFRLARVMKQFRPHIVHTRNFGALEAIPATRLAGVPIAIHSEHGYELETLAGLPLRRRLFSCGCYAIADAVFTVTHDLRSYHSKQSWFPAGRIRVIYNGVNTERFFPRLEYSARIRRELDIPVNRTVIGSVGRLVAIKDHGTLVRAAENLASQGKDVHVLIVGSGPELSKLRSIAQAAPALLGRVTFMGESDRVPELMSAMDIFVLTSICEGMSNTILEAMASGLPAIVTQAGGNPEIIEEGHSGWLFSPRDADKLAEHLLRLTEDCALRRRAGEAARRRAVEYFSLDRMTQQYMELYLEIAARRRVRQGA